MIRTDTGYVRNINNIFIAIVSVVGLLALWQIRGIVMLVIAAVFLSIFMNMPVRYLQRRGLKRGFAIFLSMGIGVFILILLSLLVFPALLSQFAVLFTRTIPNGIDQLVAYWSEGHIYEDVPFLEGFRGDLDQLFSDIFILDAELINQVVNQISSALSNLGGSVIPLVSGVASALLSFLIVIFICAYIIAEPDRYKEGFITLTPLWYRDRMREIVDRMDDTIEAWLLVTGVSMLFTGIATAIGLALIGIEQWAALGVLAGLFSFIPNFGPIAAIVPSVAVAAVQAPNAVLIVVVIIYGVSFVQSQVIGPILASERMNLAPVLILIGQIVFGVFFGFIGIMLAVPLTAIFVLLVDEIYVKDVLGDTNDDEGKPRDRDMLMDEEHELLPEVD